ncbi:hypothetical protein PR202_ga22225 [Eleusine coracana subsp. coracana]|uniref:Phospholipase A2 n=1 Tax=Eleusine coracana subsp. coracana TaxID=191504 RepID=A0AAV5D3Q7_ELECO|nr:hypothetical protein PR202_ga22225 [Eleusine coracana subsp. coracana]
MRKMECCRRELLLTVLLLLLLAVADRPSLAAASFFGVDGDTDSDQDCSRTCESEHCAAAPLMRYGKYCGVSYTGCPGEAPCDALDACCMIHDACVQATDKRKTHIDRSLLCMMSADDYLNMWCNQSLLDCVAAVRPSTTTFAGNSCNVTEVADEITSLVEAAVFAKRILHKP